MICLDCGDNDIRYDEKEKSYHCNNCGSRHLGSHSKGCGIKDCLSCSNSFSEPCEDGDILHCMENDGEVVGETDWCAKWN